MSGIDLPASAEISQLLDKCTPEELRSILQELERGFPENEPVTAPMPAPAPMPTPATQPIPPPAPPPAPPPGGARRPAPLGVRRPAPAPSASETHHIAGGAEGCMPVEASTGITETELRAMLEQHSASLLDEVRKMIPPTWTDPTAPPVPALPAPGPAPMASHSSMSRAGLAMDAETLARMLVDRDSEVRALEKHLADLQSQLAAKDKRAVELGTELDSAVREVRHRQLDLELQQLKLEERVRSNAELEQAQRLLSARVAEASLQSRHAALDMETARSLSTPRSARIQGTLPWTLRKNKLPGLV